MVLILHYKLNIMSVSQTFLQGKLRGNIVKKLFAAVFASLFLLAASTPAQAVPMYYTFNGTVYSLNDGAGAIASQLGLGFGVGSTVTYTFIVDFGADGSMRQNDLTVINRTDEPIYDYFYTDYFSGGPLLTQVGVGAFNAATDIAEYNYGFNGVTVVLGSLRGNSADDLLAIVSYDYFISDWVEGTQVYGTNLAYASDGTYSVLDSQYFTGQRSSRTFDAVASRFRAYRPRLLQEENCDSLETAFKQKSSVVEKLRGIFCIGGTDTLG